VPQFGARRACPTSGASHARGFTLIELMIVVALIAIAAGVVSLALRDRPPRVFRWKPNG
jgi:general secretion pathway protein H